MSAEALNQRGMLRGVQCVCGQWWPDFTVHGRERITECCGSVYIFQTGETGFATLSLVTNNTQRREGEA
jgi:hypothetical protein